MFTSHTHNGKTADSLRNPSCWMTFPLFLWFDSASVNTQRRSLTKAGVCLYLQRRVKRSVGLPRTRMASFFFFFQRLSSVQQCGVLRREEAADVSGSRFMVNGHDRCWGKENKEEKEENEDASLSTHAKPSHRVYFISLRFFFFCSATAFILCHM